MTAFATYIDVAVALPVHKTYTYGIPEHLEEKASPGKRVLVPFGRRRVTGYIQAVTKQAEMAKIKAVIDILDKTPLYPEAMIPFFQWVADYYLHPIGLVIKTALPAGLNLTEYTEVAITDMGRIALTQPNTPENFKKILQQLDQKPTRHRQMTAQVNISITKEILGDMNRLGWIEFNRRLSTRKTQIKTEQVIQLIRGEIKPLTPPRKKIIQALKKSGDLPLAQLKKIVPTAATVVRKMVAVGAVTIHHRPVYRDPFGDTIRPDTPHPLISDQQKVVKEVTHALNSGFSTYLLAGVTGSGKTEVYLTLVQRVIKAGGQALVLVPEIALISQVERRFRARFGDQVAVLHSSLSAGERFDQWRRIVADETPVVIGARSAVFAPLKNVKLLIVDEEHDSAFKQETGLRYQARDLAIVRGKLCRAPVLLGSATPSIQSIFNANSGKYRQLVLPRRINQRPLPAVDIVDLRQAKSMRGPQRIISPKLHQAIRKTLDRGEQVLLFLNRRGFAGSPICLTCGAPVHCRHCDITLTLHQAHNAYKCHYCGFSRPATIQCAGCGGSAIRALGMGTEKVETLAQKLFPDARITRMDRDTTARKGASKQILKALKEGRVDILIGTQMVAKGHDFPNITLVGIICADLSLDFPDFRAGERTYQLLAQVAGRAGRGESSGRVILQTYNPDHFSIQAAKVQDYVQFYQQEIQFRQALDYPPYTLLAQLKVSAKDKIRSQKKATAIGMACRKLQSSQKTFTQSIAVLGPIEAPLAKISGRYRWQILIKAKSSQILHRFLHQLYTIDPMAKTDRRVQVIIDIDPYLMM